MDIQLYIKYLVWGLPILIILLHFVASYYNRNDNASLGRVLGIIRNVLILGWIIAGLIMLTHRYQPKADPLYPGPKVPVQKK